MRKLIVTEFISLDGVMEAPGGEAGYPHAGLLSPFFSADLGAYKQDEQLSADVLLLGRRTYESFAGAWPARQGPGLIYGDKLNCLSVVWTGHEDRRLTVASGRESCSSSLTLRSDRVSGR